MNDRNLKLIIMIVLILSMFFLLGKIVFFSKEVNNYETCVDAGHRVVSGNPPQCIAPDGTMYTGPKNGTEPESDSVPQ